MLRVLSSHHHQHPHRSSRPNQMLTNVLPSFFSRFYSFFLSLRGYVNLCSQQSTKAWQCSQLADRLKQSLREREKERKLPATLQARAMHAPALASWSVLTNCLHSLQSLHSLLATSRRLGDLHQWGGSGTCQRSLRSGGQLQGDRVQGSLTTTVGAVT